MARILLNQPQRTFNSRSQSASDRPGLGQKPSAEGRNVKRVEAGFCLPARINRNIGNICKANTTSESTSHSIGTHPAAALRAQKLFATPAPLQLASPLSLACLLLLLGLEVLVGEVGSGTTDEHDGVHADAEAGGIARRRRSDGTGLGGLGGRVSGLLESN